MAPDLGFKTLFIFYVRSKIQNLSRKIQLIIDSMEHSKLLPVRRTGIGIHHLKEAFEELILKAAIEKLYFLYYKDEY
jgi:hypothetical protein